MLADVEQVTKLISEGTPLIPAGATPKVFFGPTGEVSDAKGVAMHVTLPAQHRAEIGIVNIFDQGAGDEISFPASGFEVAVCEVNGERQNFHDYVVREKLDERLPLVADFCGAKINVCVRALDADARKVSFFAPVFEGVKYRLAAPVDDYAQRFSQAIPADLVEPAFSCNCILNLVYGELLGNPTGSIVGPVTFGEIAYQLVNQTMVHVTVVETN